MKKQNQRFVFFLTAFLMLVMACAVSAQESTDPDTGKTVQESIVLKADGETISKTVEEPIESEGTAVSLSAVNQGSVTLTAQDIFGIQTGALIETESNGTAVLNSYSIASEAAGLSVYAESGKVNVHNEGFIDGYRAVSLINEGAEVDINAGELDSVVGVSITASGGTTKLESDDIYAEGYGVIVDAAAENSAPVVTVAVNGGISDQYASESWEDEINEDPIEPIETQTEAKEAEGELSEESDPEDTWIEDDDDFYWGDDSWDGSWDDEVDPEEGEDSLDSTTGVQVSASGKGTAVTVDVSGDITMGYGNEVQSESEAVVNVSVGGAVITDSGNRIAAVDKGKAVLTFGGDITAGGIALDTYNDSGELTVTAKGEIAAADSDEGDFETVGIYSASEGNGITTIQAAEGILISSQEEEMTAYGIAVGNAGGKVSITSEKGLIVFGDEAVGIYVMNDPDANAFGEEDETESEPKAAKAWTEPETSIIIRGNVSADASNGASGAELWNTAGKTELLIYGDLTSSETGLIVDTFDGAFTDILVTGTLTGNDAALVVNAEADNDEKGENNLALTLWKLNGPVQNEDGTENKTAAENIRYIVGIADEGEGKIIPTDENGKKLPVSHGYYYAKQGQRVYLAAAEGVRLIQVYNGKDEPTALPQDDQGRYYIDVQPGGGVWLSADTAAAPASVPSMEFFRIGSLSWLMDVQLPATGFSSGHVTALPARPEALNYKDTGFTLQIPELDVEEKIVTVPQMDERYPVEWLGHSVGLLEQSSLPGKGVTVLTGHNHLNTTETGPFLFIGQMREGDRILLTDARDNLQAYKVYGNYQIASDGFASIAEEVRENALILITCEDESVDGGYLHRRVVMAEPL